ncbi:putative VPS9 domain-containing protein [Plasmopara halstedii]
MDDTEQVQLTNQQLHSKVADLTKRCQFLTTAVEKQDKVIASLCAATLPTSISNYSSNSRQTEQRTSMKSFTGVLGITEPVHEMVESQSDLKGYKNFDTRNKSKKDVIKINLDQISYSPRTVTNENATPSVDSSSSFATASSSSSLFGDVGEPVTKFSRSKSSPQRASLLKRRPSLERQVSSPTNESFASSAGFLRKSNRTMSGRLSVSDLGLLHNDDGDDMESNQTLEDTHFNPRRQFEETLKRVEDTLDVEERIGPMISTISRSQRNLFADVDESIQAKANQTQADTNPANNSSSEIDGLSYGEFLQRISLPASRDILDKMRMFVGSILGPRGDGQPPRSTDYVEYDFYGHHEFRRRCSQFFVSMDDLLQTHPVWCHASETILTKARDGVEKYVMDRVSDIAFNQLQECQQWMEEDKNLLRRMKLLSFITPAMLDIKPCIRNEVVWSMAEDELRRINQFCSPGDKINCIVRCCSVIFSVLNLSRGDSGSRPGADDFLPVFIYIVLHSRISRLCSNCEYISAYRNQADLMSKAGYCFVNLRSAIEFIMVMDGSMLSISDGEFQRLYIEQEKLLLKA